MKTKGEKPQRSTFEEAQKIFNFVRLLNSTYTVPTLVYLDFEKKKQLSKPE